MPGSGKTTLALQLAEKRPDRLYCIRGKSSIKNFSSCQNMSEYTDLLVFRVIVAISALVTPLTVIVFRKYLHLFIVLGKQVALTKTSNIRFFIYLIYLLNYQLTRFFLARMIHFFSGKTVIIDEGLVYNSIRLRQFIRPDKGALLNEKFLFSIKNFDIHTIKVKADVRSALGRYLLREKGALDRVFSRWYVDISAQKWRESVWLDIESWIAEVVSSSREETLSLEVLGNPEENLFKVMAYIDENG